jgi:hypothetical protein
MGSTIIAESKTTTDLRGFGRSWILMTIGRTEAFSTRFIPLGGLHPTMSLEETVDYLAEELDLERSEHVREVGQSVAELRD